MTTVRVYYENAVLSQAAYADLDGMNLTVKQSVVLALQKDTSGNQDTNLPITLANYVWDNYSIQEHYSNDSTGFSGTVFKNISTGEITLAFRGTEPFQDTLNDVLTADIYGVVKRGIALEQVVAAYNWYQQLTAQLGGSIDQLNVRTTSSPPVGGKSYFEEFITVGEVTATQYVWLEQVTVANTGDSAGKLIGENLTSINTTGHSLGGHLATAISRIFSSSVDQTYTYNGPGFGTTIAEKVFNEMIPGAASSFDTAQIENPNGIGTDLIAGYNMMYGKNEEIFIE